MTQLLSSDHLTKQPALFGEAIDERDSDLYNSLGLAAQSVWGLIFRLSFAATLAIVALFERLVCLCLSAW